MPKQKANEPFLIEDGITTQQQVWKNKNMLMDVMFVYLTNEERFTLLTQCKVQWFWDLWIFFCELETRAVS